MASSKRLVRASCVSWTYVLAVALTKPEIYQGFAQQLRTRLLSYAPEVAIAAQRTIATTTPTMVTMPETVARLSAGLDHKPLFSCCHRRLTNIILNFCHLCSRR
jgi:hypothetical protein